MRTTILGMCVAVLCCGGASAQNLLVNSGFETNGTLGFGNNIGVPVTSWANSGTHPFNVVEVDGPGGSDFLNKGPESDATAPGAGIKQHYLDIAGGPDRYYQTFTPTCSGTVEFSGYFATAADSSGSAKIEIRSGSGVAGALQGTASMTLPAGNSKTDPWQKLTSTVALTAGTTYSFVVEMHDFVYLDNAFVGSPCEKPCMEVKIQDPVCDKNGAYTVTATVVNHTGHPVQYVMIAQPAGSTYTVSPNVIPVSLNDGQGTNVTVTVSGAAPEQQICLDYYLQDVEGRTCCRMRKCVKLPECSCLRVLEQSIVCDPGPATYAYTFTYQNFTGYTIQQLFVIPSSGTVTPQLVATNVLPNGTATVTLHLSGVSAGQTVYFTLMAYGAEATQCCTTRVSIKLPIIHEQCD